MSRYAVRNPATNELVNQYPTIDRRELMTAVEQASSTQRTWSRETTVEERAALVARAGELHTERRQQLAEIIVREMGKPLEQALDEIDFCADIYRHSAEIAPKVLADQPIELDSGRALVRQAPLGTLLGIMPWNYPAYQVARFAAPNLALGNTILLKHARQCPDTALALEKLFRDAGFPEHAYINIFATSEQVAEVIADPRIAAISITGSERAGQAVAEQAGRHLKKVVMELGGSDPFILLGTENMDGVVETAMAARLDNTGQACNAAKRFIVIDELYDEFEKKFIGAFTVLQTGDPSNPETILGPLSSTEAADELMTQVERAADSGAVVHGNLERRGNFISPLVLTSVAPENPAYYEEFFGPVATLHRAKDEEHAIRLANDTPFGLGSYVFTPDEEQAMRVADRLDTGMVFVNVVGAEGAELPFGGVKRSGYGRELGHLGFGEFVNKKMIRLAD